MKVLFVTHRFGREVVGGPEFHLWNLAEQLARMGCQVDVATTFLSDLSTQRLFGERWCHTDDCRFEQIEVERAECPICVHRFPVHNLPRAVEWVWLKLLQRRWEYEEMAMEFAKPLLLPFEPKAPLLLTGWQPVGLNEEGEVARWTMRRASIQFPATKAAALHLVGHAPRVISVDFKRLGETTRIFYGQGPFQSTIRLDDDPNPSVGVIVVNRVMRPWHESRTLGVQFTQISLSMNRQIYLAPFHIDHHNLRSHDKKEFIASAIVRARKRPSFYSRLSDGVRGPRCPGMLQFVKKHAGEYDWVLAGTLPFSALPAVARLRGQGKFRLAALSLFHVDDARYYWSHYLDALQCADVCLANSQFSHEVFFPAVGARSFAAGAGIRERRFSDPGISGARFRKRFGFGADEKLVLSVGRKSGTKLYRTVAKAVGNIQDRVASRFVLIGPDEDGLALSFPQTSYLGVVTEQELLDAYDACDVFCLMSESESFGMVFVEAWMREKAVIGNRDCAPVASLIRDGENGYLVSRREELEKRLVELLNDPAKARLMGQAGLRQALEKHTWRAVARKVLDQFEAGISGEA